MPGPKGEHGVGARGSEEHWLWLDTECMTHAIPFYSVTLRGWSSVIIPILLIGPIEAQGDFSTASEGRSRYLNVQRLPAQPQHVRLCRRPHLAAGLGERQWWRFLLVGLSVLNHVWNVALGQLQVRDVAFWRLPAGSPGG